MYYVRKHPRKTEMGRIVSPSKKIKARDVPLCFKVAFVEPSVIG